MRVTNCILALKIKVFENKKSVKYFASEIFEKKTLQCQFSVNLSRKRVEIFDF